MKPVKPDVIVPGDNVDSVILSDTVIRPRVMARSGNLIGTGLGLAVWRFGFGPASNMAALTTVHYEGEGAFLWVMADEDGEVGATFDGPFVNLPMGFTEVLSA